MDCHTIEEYFPVLNKMELILNENECLRKKLVTTMRRNYTFQQHGAKENENCDNLSNMLRLLLSCAKSNAMKKQRGKRYDSTMKELGSLIFILGGLDLYKIFAANLPLPSVTTIRRKLSTVPQISEGEFRFKQLKKYLLERNLPLMVWVSEDATRVNGRIQYDPKSNQVVGFVPFLTENGIPAKDSFPATSAAIISKYFESGTVSNNAYCIMVQPLAVNAPAFSLALFGTDNKFTSLEVTRRFDWMYNKAKEEGITLLGFSSDGDPRLLKAMVQRSLSNQPSHWPWFSPAFCSPDQICIQDVIHIIVKLKSRLLRPSSIYPFGKKCIASKGHIVELINNFSKDLHELTISFMNPKDKMNFRAAQKLCDEKVSTLLRSGVSESEGTATYLDMTRNIMTSFLDTSLSPLERIELIWQWVFFLRFWRKWLLKQDGYTLSHNFITSNTYTCIEINAHGLIQVIQHLRDSEEHRLFLPWLFSSQPCEDFFRQARSLTAIKSTITNFSILELEQRAKRIDYLSELYKNLQSTLTFPNAKKLAKKMEEQSCDYFLPEDYEIEAAVQKAFQRALALSIKFGIAKQGAKIPALTISEISLDEKQPEEDELDGEQVDIDTEESSEECTNAIDTDVSVCDSMEESENLVEDLCVVSTGSLGLKVYDNVKLTSSSPFVKVKDGTGQIAIIRKSSLVWLLSSGDTRLSSDRLQRVQAMDVLHKTGKLTSTSLISSQTPICRKDSVSVGDWCAFYEGDQIFIGRILSFSYMSGTSWTAQQYSGHTAPTSPTANIRKIGCLCSWFRLSSNKLQAVNMDIHGYYGLQNYICSLPRPEVVGSQLYLKCTVADIKNCG